MASEHILRVPRSDSEGDFVLVNVAANGSSPLDLKLLATEGESPYITTSEVDLHVSKLQLTTDPSSKVKQSRISKLRDKRCQLSDHQWESILLSTLLRRRIQIQKPGSASVEKLEIIATLAGDVIAIHFRNNISGITQKLGEIILKQDETQVIDSISWAGTAVQRSTELEAEVQDLTSKYDEQSKTMEKLNKQLEDLIEAKKTHEDELLLKFRELLNTKKLKIRDQQRLLAGAKVDVQQAGRVQNARQASKLHTPAASRVAKRKAKGAATVSSSSEEDSFEQRAATKKDESDRSEQVNTSEASDQDATEDDSDDDLDSAPRASTMPGRNKADEDGRTRDEEMQLDTPPPVRELPFGKADDSGGRKQMPAPAADDRSTLNQEAGNEGDETDDDDEL